MNENNNTNVEKIKENIIRHHLHPITVHVPNGVLPVAVLFMIISALFNTPVLEKAAFYNLLFVVLSMPVVLYTGTIEWKNRYGGRLSKLFKKKIVSAAVVAILSTFIVIWRLFSPSSAVASNGLYLFFHITLLAVAGYAGSLGGKVAFMAKDKAWEQKQKKKSA